MIGHGEAIRRGIKPDWINEERVSLCVDEVAGDEAKQQ